MPTLDCDRIAHLVKSWRAFEQTHAETATKLRMQTQCACEALATDYDLERILTQEAVRALRETASLYARELGFDNTNEKEFLFWATVMCLILTTRVAL